MSIFVELEDVGGYRGLSPERACFRFLHYILAIFSRLPRCCHFQMLHTSDLTAPARSIDPSRSILKKWSDVAKRIISTPFENYKVRKRFNRFSVVE